MMNYQAATLTETFSDLRADDLFDIEQMRLVILEDDSAATKLLKHILKREGFTHIDTFSHPQDLFEACSNKTPDLFLLDLNLPGESGFEVMQKLRQNYANEYVPFIFLTSDERYEVKQKILGGGGQEFLKKPYMISEIALRVKNLLQTRRLYLIQQHHMRQLEIALQERERQLEQANVEMLVRLAHAVESTHIFKDDQIWRVATLASQIALELGLKPDHVNLILRAARLHDIGKITLPSHILLKPSSLSENEFELVKTHTTKGAQILSGAKYPLMQLAETIALTHHERWDGNGYPKGLKGQEIPLEGRILAVADAFHALTRERAHQASRRVPEAVTEIEAHSGTQFDSMIVEALVSLYKKGELSLDTTFTHTMF